MSAIIMAAYCLIEHKSLTLEEFLVFITVLGGISGFTIGTQFFKGEKKRKKVGA